MTESVRRTFERSTVRDTAAELYPRLPTCNATSRNRSIKLILGRLRRGPATPERRARPAPPDIPGAPLCHTRLVYPDRGYAIERPRLSLDFLVNTLAFSTCEASDGANRPCGTVERNARSHRPASVVHDGPPACLRAGLTTRTGRGPSAHAQSGHALPGPGPARTARMDQGQLAQDGKQSRRKVLRHHSGRPPRRRVSSRTVAPFVGPRQQAAARLTPGMVSIRRFVERVLNLFRVRRPEHDLAREIDSH